MKTIDVQEFDLGVKWWRTETRWPQDFHNAEYELLAAQNPQGAFTDEWWEGFLLRLSRWRALRPLPRAKVTGLLVANRDDLATAWHLVCGQAEDKDIAAVTWGQIGAFCDVVARLKPVRSPVFTSKFCHFLLPQVFPVFDNRAVGGSSTYEEYFRLIKGTWELTSADLRAVLIRRLTRLVEGEQQATLFAGFPMATKITELALIGRRHS